LRPVQGLRLVALFVIGAIALAGCGGNTATTATGGSLRSGTTIKVGLAYDVGGRGDKSFNDSAASGLDKAAADLRIDVRESTAALNETTQSKASRLETLIGDGFTTLICVGFSYADALKVIAPKYPDARFAIIDSSDVSGQNVSSFTFKENESAFLVGALAALGTKTNTVGFIGGVNVPLIQKFDAGYRAGVKAAKPGVKVISSYLTQPPDFSGFASPDKGRSNSADLYRQGADIVYGAAGLSNNGVFQAATDVGKLAIGTDSDQYQGAATTVQNAIIGSALKGVETAVIIFLEAAGTGQFRSGNRVLGLKENGVGYVINNVAFERYASQIDDLKLQIVDGKITVPEKL
jgi:basic membrane protein A